MTVKVKATIVEIKHDEKINIYITEEKHNENRNKGYIRQSALRR